MKIKITADSTCDLRQELVERYNISVVPLYVNMDDKPLLDRVEVEPQEIFDYYGRTGKLAYTSARNIGEYIEDFEKAIEGNDAVIHISIGSGFSSTYQNALLAAQDVENVYVFDSSNLSSGQGIIVLRACELVEEGKNVDEILTELKAVAEKVDTSFVLDQLDYLHKGGRCSGVAALGANLLKLKPCIEVVNGKMQVGKKYRGNLDKCIGQYIHERFADADAFDTSRVFVTYAGIKNESVELACSAVRECLGENTEIVRTTAGCTITSHCGPGTLGVIALRK